MQWITSSPEAIDAWTRRRLDLRDRYWLFVLGVNNSGTSLLAHLLARHPDVRQLPSAGQGLTSGLPGTRRHGVGRNWTRKPDVFRWTEESDPTPARRIRYDWARLYPPGPGILLEKSPPNTIRSRWLQQHFRPSRFVSIVRSPYAVAEGIRRRERIPIEDAALHWARAYEYLLADLPALERVLSITYEGLCDTPAAHLRRLEEFLELEPIDVSVLGDTLPTHNRSGRDLPLENLNARSLARLSADDIAAINRIAGPVMQRLGYDPLPPA